MNTRMMALYSEACFVVAHAKRRITTLLIDADHYRDLGVHASRFGLHDSWRKSPLLERGANIRVKNRIAAVHFAAGDSTFLIDSCFHANRYRRAFNLRKDGSRKLRIDTVSQPR